MATFIIVPSSDVTTFEEAIPKRFGNKSFRMPRGEWLVSYDGTSKQLSDDLGISDGKIGASAVVLNFSGYFGRAGKDIWEWMKENTD